MNALGTYLRKLGLYINIDSTPVNILSKLKPDFIIMRNTTKKTNILYVKVLYNDYFLFMANKVYNSKNYKDLQIQLNKHK